jgi:hypothetical protein
VYRRKKYVILPTKLFIFDRSKRRSDIIDGRHEVPIGSKLIEIALGTDN